MLTARMIRAEARIEAISQQLAVTITERDMLARSLALRPDAETVADEMMARADDDGALHRASMVDILRSVGGLS